MAGGGRHRTRQAQTRAATARREQQQLLYGGLGYFTSTGTLLYSTLSSAAREGSSIPGGEL